MIQNEVYIYKILYKGEKNKNDENFRKFSWSLNKFCNKDFEVNSSRSTGLSYQKLYHRQYCFRLNSSKKSYIYLAFKTPNQPK